MLEWYKRNSIFAEWTIQNNSDTLSAAQIMWKNENNSTWVNFDPFTLIKRTFSSWVIFNLLFFKHVSAYGVIECISEILKIALPIWSYFLILRMDSNVPSTFRIWKKYTTH